MGRSNPLAIGKKGGFFLTTIIPDPKDRARTDFLLLKQANFTNTCLQFI